MNLTAERGRGGKVVFPAYVGCHRAAALPPSVSHVVGWWRRAWLRDSVRRPVWLICRKTCSPGIGGRREGRKMDMAGVPGRRL